MSNTFLCITFIVDKQNTMKFIVSSILTVCNVVLMAQNGQELTFEEYNPPSTLVVPEHPLTRAKYPFIDVPNQSCRYQQNLAVTWTQPKSIESYRSQKQMPAW